MAATHDDAVLIVQLLGWGSERGFDDALRVIFADNFNPEVALMDDPAVAKVLYFGEALSTLVKHRLLDENLLRDLLWVEASGARWDRTP